MGKTERRQTSKALVREGYKFMLMAAIVNLVRKQIRPLMKYSGDIRIREGYETW